MSILGKQTLVEQRTRIFLLGIVAVVAAGSSDRGMGVRYRFPQFTNRIVLCERSLCLPPCTSALYSRVLSTALRHVRKHLG